MCSGLTTFEMPAPPLVYSYSYDNHKQLRRQLFEYDQGKAPDLLILHEITLPSPDHPLAVLFEMYIPLACQNDIIDCLRMYNLNSPMHVSSFLYSVYTWKRTLSAHTECVLIWVWAL